MIKFFKKINAKKIIKINNYKVDIKKGKIKEQAKIFLEDLTKKEKIKYGEIIIKDRIEIFGIQEKHHQKIRNIVSL